MPEARFLQTGTSIDYTPGADIALGQVVVVGDLVGIATRPIANGVLGALTIEGNIEVAKATGGSTAIAVGTKVYWDDTNNVATATASTHKRLGTTIKAAADADAVVQVKMLQG